MRVLGLITARGGSKGIARKNIRILGGKPLLQWTIETALAAHSLSSVILSTEDEEIAAIGRRCGVAVPFLRPLELAADDTPTLPVVQHAVRTLEQIGDRFEAVCLLQPTSPFRKAVDIDLCVELLAASNADAVVSVLRVPTEYNPHWVYFRGPNEFLTLSTGGVEPVPQRQLLPQAFHRDGSMYVTRRNVLMEENSLYGAHVIGYEVNGENNINIDTPSDWLLAEAMMQGSAS